MVKCTNNSWIPNKGDTYYYLSSFGGVYEDRWISNNLNEGRLYLGNVFKNRKDALKELIRRRYSLNN